MSAVSELRGMAMQGAIPPSELSAIALAKSLVTWHQRHGFCANCGTRTRMSQGGWKRDCPSCKTEHFPRTDPVVIMLVTHGRPLPDGPAEAVSAGHVFVPRRLRRGRRDDRGRGAREILEESGIHCGDVTYYMTQPWPYPSSLMIGCTAEAIDEAITVDLTELEDARWFIRDEAMLLLKRTHPDGLTGPHPFAIAHHLLGRWLQPE